MRSALRRLVLQFRSRSVIEKHAVMCEGDEETTSEITLIEYERCGSSMRRDGRTTERSTKDSARRHSEDGMSRMTKWSYFGGYV